MSEMNRNRRKMEIKNRVRGKFRNTLSRRG